MRLVSIHYFTVQLSVQILATVNIIIIRSLATVAHGTWTYTNGTTAVATKCLAVDDDNVNRHSNVVISRDGTKTVLLRRR